MSWGLAEGFWGRRCYCGKRLLIWRRKAFASPWWRKAFRKDSFDRVLVDLHSNGRRGGSGSFLWGKASSLKPLVHDLWAFRGGFGKGPGGSGEGSEDFGTGSRLVEVEFFIA